MKKLFVMAAAALMLGACSREEVPEVPTTSIVEGVTRTVQIDFDLSIDAGMSTRAGRDLTSAEALQKVNEVYVYMFEGNAQEGSDTRAYTFKEAFPVSGFVNTAVDVTESHTVTKTLPDGYYRFLAVGVDAGKDAFQNTANMASLIAAGTSLDAAVLLLAENKAAREVFCGLDETEHQVGGEGAHLKSTIEMKRAVAGVIAYFTHVPYKLMDGETEVQVKKVTVEIATKGTGVTLKDKQAYGQTPTSGTVSNYHKLISIDISGTESENGNYYERDAQQAKDGKPSLLANSYFGAAFAMPVNKITGNNTMKVVLYGDGDKKLKEYPVKCVSTSTAEVPHTDTSYVFNIMANQLYSIGMKPKSDNMPDPADPDKPVDPNEPDKPIDLSKDDIITVTVNPNWDKIHEMGF